MRMIFLAVLLSGTAAGPAISATAEQATHHTNSGQHQSSQHSRSSAPGGAGQRGPGGPSSHYSRPTGPGGTGQRGPGGSSPHYSRPTGPGGTGQHGAGGPSSHYSRPTGPGGTGQHGTGGPSSHYSSPTGPGDTGQHGPGGSSSHYSRPTGPGGSGQYGTGGSSSHYSGPTGPGGSGQYGTGGSSSHYSGPTGPGATGHYRRSLPVSSTPRFGTQPPLRHDGHRSEPHWNNSWRHDNRYNWHDYRQRHYSTYHLGYYHDPFGWAYQSFAIGWRLWPNYYSSAYWINDPWMYRLPPAPPGTRWIRYYNDALLVDTWTGEVVDVIQNFFW